MLGYPFPVLAEGSFLRILEAGNSEGNPLGQRDCFLKEQSEGTPKGVSISLQTLRNEQRAMCTCTQKSKLNHLYTL